MKTDTAENGYHRGYPLTKGYYDCLVEGEEMRLYHFICAVNGKHKWYISSHEEYRGEVLWKDPNEN
jgi:hypothetical protein